MMQCCVIGCLLLGVISSAPLSSDSGPWSASSSDEDPQLPALIPVVGGASQQAPPSLIMEVEDTEKNLTLSFAIFILPEEEEGSTMDGGGRSDDSSKSDDVSSEESSSQDIRPIAALLPSETASGLPLRRKHDDSLIVSVMESPSSEELMNDQPVLSFPGEEFDDFNNTFNRKYWDQRQTLSEDSDSLNKSTETNPRPAGFIDDDFLDSGSISKDFRFGLNFRGVFGSIQEVMDLLSGKEGGMGGRANHHKGRGATPDSVTGRQVGLGESSEESLGSLETVSFSRVGSDSGNPSSVSPDPDSKGSPKATFSFQNSSDPLTTLTYDSISPDSDSREVQDTYKGSNLNLVSRDQDVSPVVLNVPQQTMSQIHSQGTRLLPQVGVTLTSDSSEESPLGLTTSGPGLSRAGSLEDSSSSEEVLLAVSSSVPSPQTPTESDGSESEDQTSASDSGSDLEPPGHGPGNDSQSAELLPDPDLEFSPGLETNFSSTPVISEDESEESQTPKTPKDANATGGSNSASIASSSEVSMGLQDAEVDLSSVHDVSTIKDPAVPAYTTSPPSETVSSGGSSDANTDAGSDLSAEEEDASKETDSTDSAVNMKPTAPTRYITHPPYSRASTDANANIEKKQTGSGVYSEANTEANNLGRNQSASSVENITPPPPRPPPRRKKPYRFGSLGPIHYSHNNQPVARETVSEEKFPSLVTNTRGRFKPLQPHRNKQHVHSSPLHTFFRGQYNSGRERHLQTADPQRIRKLTRVSLAKVANQDQSSSEETN